MHPFLSRIISSLIIRRELSADRNGKALSAYKLARAYRVLKINAVRFFKDFILIGLGISSAAFGLEGFLLPNHLIDGGATGISLLVSEISRLPIALLIILVNVPFVLVGYRILGKIFAVKTSLAIFALSVVLAFVEFPEVTNDIFLASFFGGFFLGAGIGMAVRGGSVIDGTEVLAIYLSKKLSATMGDVVLVFNVLIFSLAAYLLSIEVALYSMVTYLAASKTLDFFVEGIEEYIGVTIVASRSDEIRTMITEKLGRGVTIYTGKKGYRKNGANEDVEIVYTVITRLELNKLNTEIEKIEPDAFVVMNSVKDTRGGMIKKRPLKH
jgi:uncharacterized membrane-anchored protein YitT (DUF2179 family)